MPCPVFHAGGPAVRLNMNFEQLPAPAREWLTKLETIINEWEWKSGQLPEVRDPLAKCDRLSTALEQQAELSADGMRQDEALLAAFKQQVEANLADARTAETEFVRRFELQAYGRHGAIPSPYFSTKLTKLAQEVATLRERIVQLDGAVASSSKKRPQVMSIDIHHHV